jgi:Co/Zn/Cd efflux system component
MSVCDEACGVDEAAAADNRSYRNVLWLALAINAAMFGVEAVAGLHAGSVSLQADSLDFFGDAANYGISLFVLARTMRWRASASLVKGATMAVFGLWILGLSIYKAFVVGLPSAAIMGAVGTLALVANLVCAAVLFRFRFGESNRRSVWICSRNDAIGNIAVVLAASGVFFSATPWPDLFVGSVMALLALSGACQIIRHALEELRGLPGLAAGAE